MTEEEYYAWFEGHGFKRTGESTLLLEEWSNETRPTGKRYCMNGVALSFEAAATDGGSR